MKFFLKIKMLKPKDHFVDDIKFNKENNLKWKEDFYFIQAADTQMGLIRRYEYVIDGMKEGKKGWIDGEIKEWSKEKELCEETVRLVNQLEPRPKFMIICGDILDQFPLKIDFRYEDGRMTDEQDPVRKKQLQTFREVFSKLEIPLLCLCGNHDLGDKMTFKSVKQYESEFGDTWFQFYLDGVMFIVLNSQLYFDPNECVQMVVDQDNWLQEALKESIQFKHTIVLQHHPLFTETIDEEDTYFNLPRNIRQTLVKKFIEFGVRKIFNGHFHKNSIAYHKSLEVVTTSAIGLQLDKTDNHGFRVVKVEENDIKHKYYALKDRPSSIEF